MSGPIISRLNTILSDFIAEGSWYMGLFTSAAAANGAGFTEVSVPEYERKLVTFGAPSGGIVGNSIAVTFPAPVSTGGYGIIVQMGLFDDPSPLVATTAQWLLDIPGGSFTMPVGYNKAFQPGYLTLELRQI